MFFASQSTWEIFWMFPFFLAASILQSPVATRLNTLVHIAVPTFWEAVLEVAVTGSFISVYRPPYGKLDAQPLKRVAKPPPSTTIVIHRFIIFLLCVFEFGTV